MAKDEEATNVQVQEVPKKTWRRHVWDTLDKPRDERHLLFKLDVALLGLGCLGYFTKYLSQANLTNAFVSGMKEDLGMFGNELNYAQTAFTVGYILGEVPANIILTRVRPSIFIPTLQIIWTLLTFCLAATKTTTQLYVLRFFLGLFEAGYYPGLNWMIGSWYRKDEMAKRAGILNASGSAAQLFSGFLMTGVINLGGRGGLPGWKWLFVMDGVISFPIAVISFIYLPDLPETGSNKRIFKKEEIELAQHRMVLEERKPRAKFTKEKIIKVLTSWPIYLMPLYYICMSATGGTPIFPQYLKYHKNPTYTVAQINLYPSGQYAIQVVSALAYAWASDTFLRGRRWEVLLFGSVLNVIFWSSLAAWDISEGWRWVCYYLQAQHVGLSGIIFTWVNEICTDDTEKRAIVLATTNSMVSMVNAWLPLIVWQQVDAPKYHKGFITATCMGAACLIIIPAMKLLQDRDQRR
ncbi:permease of the major facilitator superfamily [Chaetomium sp. MPI-SDFR-AT-0129]|nr:permease of the major facilitator superfamily [Chaetomium sp. MPI-SDFR-AT-0129]